MSSEREFFLGVLERRRAYVEKTGDRGNPFAMAELAALEWALAELTAAVVVAGVGHESA